MHFITYSQECKNWLHVFIRQRKVAPKKADFSAERSAFFA